MYNSFSINFFTLMLTRKCGDRASLFLLRFHDNCFWSLPHLGSLEAFIKEITGQHNSKKKYAFIIFETLEEFTMNPSHLNEDY